ncbi:MAG: hypothetical protein U1C74_14785 [Phenylobacterium sp.]|nr:hypothetical protein [Phenylobacterium sp.]
MAAQIIRPIQLVGTTGLVGIYTVPTGKKARIDLRVCNIHATNDGLADVYLVDEENGANSGYRTRNHEAPFSRPGAAIDLERGLLLVEGMTLQIRASAADTLAFSLTGVLDDE